MSAHVGLRSVNPAYTPLGAPVVAACMEKGFLINCIQDTVLRFVPPLIIGKADIDALVDCLDDVL